MPIKVKTREPGAARELSTEATIGDDGLWLLGAVAGGPLAIDAGLEGAWRAVLERAVSDGFRDNRYLVRDDTNGRDEMTARLRFRLGDPGGRRADLSFLYADFDNRYDAFAVDNGFDTLSDRPGRDAQRSTGASLDLGWPLAGSGELRSIAGAAASDIVASFDADWGNDRDWGIRRGSRRRRGDLARRLSARAAALHPRPRRLFYDEASRGLVLAFKHADRTHAAPTFGRWLARAGAELLATADLVAPVPLHWTRLAWRRYNQAALLANAAARMAGRPCVPDLLVRVRPTPQQGNLGRMARRRNVRGAFRVRSYGRRSLAGRRVVLVDDVFTTGATPEACARVLLDGGAAAVDVLTLARVVRPMST